MKKSWRKWSFLPSMKRKTWKKGAPCVWLPDDTWFDLIVMIDPALNSQMCQPVCLDFTSILWSYGEGVRDNGHVCRAQVCHEGFQTKGYRGSRIPKSSAYPVRKRKWLGHITQSMSLLVLQHTHTHKGTLFSPVFSSKPYLRAMSSLCRFSLKYFGIIYILQVVRKHLKCLHQAPTFQRWLVSIWNALIRDWHFRGGWLSTSNIITEIYTTKGTFISIMDVRSKLFIGGMDGIQVMQTGSTRSQIK